MGVSLKDNASGNGVNYECGVYARPEWASTHASYFLQTHFDVGRGHGRSQEKRQVPWPLRAGPDSTSTRTGTTPARIIPMRSAAARERSITR